MKNILQRAVMFFSRDNLKEQNVMSENVFVVSNFMIFNEKKVFGLLGEK